MLCVLKEIWSKSFVAECRGKIKSWFYLGDFISQNSVG